MRLTDFELARDVPFGDHREINGLTRPLVEEFRFELGSRPRVEAPFGKLNIRLFDLNEEPSDPRVLLLLDVLDLPAAVDFSLLRSGSSAVKDAALLDTVDAALARVRDEFGWSDPVPHEIVEHLRGLPRLGWIELEYLARRDRRSGMQFRVVYEVAEGWSAVHVLVEDPDGRELRRERVAFAEPMRWLERLFPVRSAILRDGAFVLRDMAREPLAHVRVEPPRG